MNKRVKKCFICCLVLSLFFTSFPQLLVYAENTEQPVQSKVSEEVEYVTFVEDETNELGMSEEKVVSVEEIAPYVILADGETLPQIKTDEVSVLSDDVVQLDTEDALYQYLKEQVVARNSQITVSVPIEINNKIGPVSAMTSAQEYTESCTGQEGDALKYGGVGYSVSTRSYTGATRVTYTYYMNYFSTAEQEKQLTSAVTCALASLNLNGKTDVEKVIAIHNYICDHVDYDYDGLSDSTNTVKYTAYGALCNGKAVCNGYAVLFYRMCKDAGLSVRIIPGTANGGAHAWNIVRVGNVYYNVDTTWDGQDTQTFNRYLLKNENDFSADHTRRENCATEEFNDAYPMAEQSYVLPATDSDLPAINHDTPLNIDNTWIFENVTTNNEIISTQAVGKPKLLIYFISVYDCLSQFQGLYKENADLDIIAMPMDTAVKEDVQKFQELYDYKNITFTYEGKDSLIADQLGRYLYLKDCNRVCYPFFVYIDQNNKIQYMSTDDNKYSIQNNLDFYCNFGNNKMVDVKYDPNGGDGNCITKSYPLNQRVILEECKYSRTGYRFKGWSQGLDSRLYKSGEAFMPYDRTVTLYAKWEAVESNNIKIVDQPVDKTVEEGMTTSFTVKAEGEGLSYQWQYKQAGSTTWSDWSGQTKETLKVGYLEKRNGMSFRCIVKDASGYKTISDEAKLTYVNGPKIIQQPENKTVEEGMTTSFTVKAEGEGLSYQWQYKQAGSTTWSDWSGQTKETLKVGYLEKRNGMSFRCIVKDASGYKTISNEALLIYNQKVQTTFSKTSGNVTFKVQYPENITCGMPTTFKLSSEGTTDKVQYALYSLTTEDGTIVYDTSYGSNGKFFSKDSFDFTFYASGTYYIRFAIMDTGVSPYVWFNTGLYGIKLVIDDKGYPTVENVVADLKAQCGKTCTTDFEKAVWFNDWLVENCRYDSSYSYCAPEGALARGSGTCEAYHRAYVMLLNSVGIATDRISGDGHVWTGVQLDGNWYHIDTTWDDAGYEDNSVDLQHLYFGLNDELMNQIHSSVTSSNGISAHSLEDNYFIKTGKIKKWSDQYVSTIREHLNNGENTFDITINDSMIDSYKQIIYYLVAYQLSNTDWGGEKLTVTYSENILHCVVE